MWHIGCGGGGCGILVVAVVVAAFVRVAVVAYPLKFFPTPISALCVASQTNLPPIVNKQGEEMEEYLKFPIKDCI